MNRKIRRAAKKRNKNQNPKTLSQALKKAIGLHQQGSFEEAEKIYRKIIATSSPPSDVFNFLGILAHQTGRSEEAIELLHRSIQLNPDYSDAYNNLGNVYKEMGQLKEATTAYNDSLKINPENANALSNLGTVLKEQKKYSEAVAFYKRAIKINPKHADAYHNLGIALKKLGKVEEAVTAYRKAIGLRPYDANAYQGLGRMFFRENRHKEAVGLFKQWLQFAPNNPIAQHMYAACSGKGIPDRASDGYVTKTFDSFSGSFDQVLEGLEYRAPELVLSSFKKLPEAETAELTILDAGCGTGLCGPLMQPYAKQLIGVDLSSGMVAKARGRKLYNELHVAELVQFIKDHPQSYDLIISADTLCYFGGLQRVLLAAYDALIEGGYFIFTLENMVAPDEEEEFRLNPHGRYSHSRSYVEHVLQTTQFELRSISHEVLRKEAGEQVEGMVVVAGKYLKNIKSR